MKIDTCFYCYGCNNGAFYLVDEPLTHELGEVVELPKPHDCPNRGTRGYLLWQKPLEDGCQMMEDEFQEYLV